jgi:hypothetical protein
MAIQTSVNRRNCFRNDEEEKDNGNHHDYDEEIEETEDDLIENYLYLTQRCGLLRHSPTTGVLDTLQQQQNQSVFARQYSWAVDDDHRHDFERSFHSSRPRSSLNDYNNNNNNNYQKDCSIISRVPPTIYYNENDDDNSFSLVKLFARMKARLNHDQRYRPKSTHELLREEDSPEWFELTKNIRTVLTKALLPNGDYDTLYRQNKSNYHRQNSQKKSRDYEPVLPKEIDGDENKIHVELDDELNTEGDQEYDDIIWNKFRKCSRGIHYRRYGICKAVDRQQYQGQLVYVYGVANNILIDENLKASGLG